MGFDLSLRLMALRRERGISQEALAERLGLSRQAVSKWERGESLPDIENLILLARFYDLTMDGLLGDAAPFASVSTRGLASAADAASAASAAAPSPASGAFDGGSGSSEFAPAAAESPLAPFAPVADAASAAPAAPDAAAAEPPFDSGAPAAAEDAAPPSSVPSRSCAQPFHPPARTRARHRRRRWALALYPVLCAAFLALAGPLLVAHASFSALFPLAALALTIPVYCLIVHMVRIDPLHRARKEADDGAAD